MDLKSGAKLRHGLSLTDVQVDAMSDVIASHVQPVVESGDLYHLGDAFVNAAVELQILLGFGFHSTSDSPELDLGPGFVAI
jgi:hypothetical protein